MDGGAKNEKVQSDTKDRLPLPPSNVSSDSSNSSDSDEDSDHSSSGSSSNGDSRLRWLYEEGKRRSQSEERILRTKVKRGNGNLLRLKEDLKVLKLRLYVTSVRR